MQISTDVNSIMQHLRQRLNLRLTVEGGGGGGRGKEGKKEQEEGKKQKTLLFRYTVK